MSWILGCYSPNPASILFAKTAAIHDPARHAGRRGPAYMAVGGHEWTAIGGRLEAGDPWVVAGLGVSIRDRELTVLRDEDWRPLLVDEGPPDGLHGHFAGAVIRGRVSVELFTDVLGLRSLYLAKTSDGFVFGTRLDWVAQVSGRQDIDIDAFGSHWLCHNQLSTRSLVSGIDRLGPGSRCVISGGSADIRSAPWTPDPGSIQHHPETVLMPFLRMNPGRGRQISLGLSGGLDSRLLLALLEADGSARLHTFGPTSHPDAAIAMRLASVSQRPIQHINRRPPAADDAWALARKHAVLANAVAPASAALDLRHFVELDEQNAFLIDGGFGEIGRRQFMNRLLLRSRRPLSKLKPADIIPHLSTTRADVFPTGADDQMRQGIVDDVASTFFDRPDIEGWSDADQVDLVAIRTRLPNFFGFEQNRLDGRVPNLMPFADRDFQQSVFGMSLRQRQHGRLYRRVIADLRPALTRVPLVKGATTYPFRMTALQAAVWTKAKSRIGLAYRDRRRDAFLTLCRPHIIDLVGSRPVTECGLYALPRLHGIVDNYYRGERTAGSALDWWLALEFWRQGLREPA